MAKNDLSISRAARFFLGNKTATVLESMAREATQKPEPPAGQMVKNPDPYSIGKGRFFSRVEDPRNGGFMRPTPDQLELLSQDAQIGAALGVIKLPIQALSPVVKHSNARVQAFLQSELDNHWQALSTHMLRALEFGFSVTEKVWTTRTVQMNGITQFVAVVDKFKDLHPASILFDRNEWGELEQVRQVMGGNAILEEPRFVRFTHDERFGNPYGYARTYRAFKFWWWSDLIYQFTNRYFEDQSVPQRVVYYVPKVDAFQNDSNQSAALMLGEQSRNGATVAFPLQEARASDGSTSFVKAWDMELLGGGSASQATADAFLGYLNHLDYKKLRAMFVPDKMIQQGDSGGSYAMLESLVEFFLRSEEVLALEIYQQICKQFLRPMIDYNFGPDLPDATIQDPKISNADRGFLKDFLKTIYTSLLNPNADPRGLEPPKIDLAELASNLGLPVQNAKPVDLITRSSQTPTEQDKSDTAPDPFKQLNRDHNRGVVLDDVPGLRPRMYNREWETQTADFQELLSSVYSDWTRTTARKLELVTDLERPQVLQTAMQDLRTLALKTYRNALPTAHSIGYGAGGTPASMQALAQQLQKIESHLITTTLPNLEQKLTQDLNDPDVNSEAAIMLRMGTLTRQAGGDYWGTIVHGWGQQRSQREQDGTAHKIRWVLDNLASHCPDCPDLAGEYDSIQDLPFLPGSGETKCGPACRCWLEEYDPDAKIWVRRIHEL